MHGIGQKEPTEGNELSSVDQVCRCRSIKMIRSRPIRSDQIKPNPTKKNCPAQSKAQAVRSKLARAKLDLGRGRWMRGNAERMNGKAKCLSDRNPFFIYDTDERGLGSRACFKISRRPAARDFGRDLGGEFRASPQRAVRNEPTPATGKRPAARRVFGQKAAWLRCSSVTDPWRVCSLVAPRHPAFCPKTGPLRILKQALSHGRNQISEMRLRKVRRAHRISRRGGG